MPRRVRKKKLRGIVAQEARHPLTVAAHRAAIARGLLEGKKQVELARDLNISENTVGRDVRALQAEWMATARMDFDMARAAALGQLEVVKQEFLAQYNKSKEPKKRTFTRQVEDTVPTGPPAPAGPPQPGVVGQAAQVAAQAAAQPVVVQTRLEASVSEEERPGNPVYLNGVLSCIDRQIKLLGLDAVDKANIDLLSMTKVYLLSPDDDYGSTETVMDAV